VDNTELAERYNAGEPTDTLAEEARMSVSGLNRRLRRIGVPPRRTPDKAAKLSKEEIAAALASHRSVAAAARALNVGRAALAAEAQRHGLRTGPGIPPDLGERYRSGATLADLARHYDTGTTTITRWLAAAGVPRRPRGKTPRDN